MKHKLYLSIIFIFFTFQIFSHEIELEDKKVEKIIKLRMGNMSAINSLSKKIYIDLNSADFKKINENTIKLKHNVIEFKELFPEGSFGGKSKEIIWEDKSLFNQYIDTFLKDIDLMLQDIENQNIVSLKNNFNQMSSNCGTCHKKFKSK